MELSVESWDFEGAAVMKEPQTLAEAMPEADRQTGRERNTRFLISSHVSVCHECLSSGEPSQRPADTGVWETAHPGLPRVIKSRARGKEELTLKEKGQIPSIVLEAQEHTKLWI